MYKFLRLHYLFFLPAIFAIPVASIGILVASPFDQDIDLAGLVIIYFYLLFILGQSIMFALIRTRPDVRLGRTFSSFDALLFTIIYTLMVALPFFLPGFAPDSGKPLSSMAARFAPELFSDSSDTIFFVLLFGLLIIYLFTFLVVIYERLFETAIEISLP